MTDILGKYIEGYHAWLVIVAHITIESFEGGWRNSSTCFLLQIELKLFEVGCRGKNLAVFLFYE